MSSTDDMLASAVQLAGEQKRAEYEHLVSVASKMVSEGNNLAKAVKHLKKAIALLPAVAAAHQVLGGAHEAMCAPDRAAQAYLAAMEKAYSEIVGLLAQEEQAAHPEAAGSGEGGEGMDIS